MNLSELHQRLARNPTYLKAYDEIGDLVLIGAAVRKLREEEHVNQADLAHGLSISAVYLSRLETGSGKVPPAVVGAVVHHFEEPLRKLGINVEPWLNIAPSKPVPPAALPEGGSRRSGIPETVSRHPKASLPRPTAEVVREKPAHKYGTKAK